MGGRTREEASPQDESDLPTLAAARKRGCREYRVGLDGSFSVVDPWLKANEEK